MPHVLQKMCFATCVLNVYVVKLSAPDKSSKSPSGTSKCSGAFFWHIVQLHSDAAKRRTTTRNRTAPQWQPPTRVMGSDIRTKTCSEPAPRATADEDLTCPSDVGTCRGTDVGSPRVLCGSG